MNIYRNILKTKHPDFYRKKYWDRNHSIRYSLSKNWHNEVVQDYLAMTNVGEDIQLIITIDAIKPHTDFDANSWLLILHNYCYQFEYNRELYDINPGDIVEFDLIIEHGLIKYKPGRNLFLGISVDVPKEFDLPTIDRIKYEYIPYI